jgi:hypothetical protein
MGVIDCFSTNVLEITAALSAVNKIVTEDMIPAVIGDVSITQLSFSSSEKLLMFAGLLVLLQVLKLLRHEMEAVRKKAVGAMHRYAK